MFPGLGGLGGGLNPKKMQAVMKQLGMNQEEIPSERVIIEKTDGSRILIENPSVTKITMQGQESFQITGEVSERAPPAFEAEDVKSVMDKASVDEKAAREALESTNGDLAEAILKLSE